jgi:hypothetical protein
MKKWTYVCFGFVLFVSLVLPVNVSSQVITTNTSTPKTGPAADYLQALLKFEPWAESVWKDYPEIPNSGYFGDGKSDGNGGIRGVACIVLNYYVLIDAFPNAPEREHRLKRIEEALRYMEESHQSGPAASLAVDGKKWGVDSTSSITDRRNWQANAWAAEMGFVAARLEKELDPEVIAGCKRVVAAEAEYRSKIPPASGYKHDTKSEENAWQSNILALAPAWMPGDPRAKKWIKAAKLYMVNTYTVPRDSTGPLKQWVKTQTLFPSYTLENHGFFHPSYEISGIMSLGDSYLMAGIINPAVLKEFQPFIEHNVRQVWDVTKNILTETGDLAFPSGMDWSLHQFEDVSCLAWMAAHFKMPEAQWGELRVAKQILHRQEVNGDGRFVGESCRTGAGGGSTDGFYVEAIQSSVIALAYLQHKMAGFPTGKGSAPKNQITHYPDVGLIIQRSKNALTTVSYGSRVMALVYPSNGTTPAQEFFTSPNTSSFIGTDGKAILKDFRTTATGFRTELELNGIKKGRRSRVIIESSPEAVVFIEIPSDTLNHSQDEWFLTAIENHPLTGESRSVLWKDNSKIIKERSGTIIPAISGGWINIDNWMGLIALSQGNFVYRAAADYNRAGAAEDAVVFQPSEKEKPRAVIVLPGKNAAITAVVQKSVRWIVSDSECKLSFIMPDGKKMTVQVPLAK